jgi:two-component system OmpR family response regulator
MPTVLVADDDPHLREVVRYALAREGFVVREAADGAAALALAEAEAFDLLVLDVAMPELDGLEVCRRLRKTSAVPIVFLSSRGEEFDRVLGLELGGDDYLAKPFSPRELVSRIRAVLRRSQAPVPTSGAKPLEVGPLRLDAIEHRVHVSGVEVALTATEFRLLGALMRHPGRVFSRDDLMAAAYEGVHHVAERTLDSHVRGVRAKLREAGSDPIETVHGVGYRLVRS